MNNIKNGIEIIKKAVANMPSSAGIYKMMGQDNTVLYIGKAKNLPKRVISYSKVADLPNRLKRMVAQLVDIEYVTTMTEAEALLLEASLIKAHKPKFNIALKDDKSFPYILIPSEHPYPRIMKFRGNPKKQKGWSFGPFASALAVNQTIQELQKIFLLRPCSDTFFASRSRPCLEYQIKRCSGPCAAKISQEDYQQNLENALDFLNGKSNTIHQKLQNEMVTASENMEYEAAAKLRDRIMILNQIQNRNTFSNLNLDNADVIALAKQNNITCIQVFFIRHNQNYGNCPFFFSNEELEGMTESEIMTFFLTQFYQKHPLAKEILVSCKLEDTESLVKTLIQLDNQGSSCSISYPQKGGKKDFMDFALSNAQQAIQAHISKNSYNNQYFRNIEELFNVSQTIQRIEIYDNSHHAGDNALGAMVVITPEGFQKNEYRIFKIKKTVKYMNSKGGDDYAMLRETLSRRLQKLDPQNMPQLLLVDGGKGHLSTAQEVLDEYNIPSEEIKLVCISKGEDRNAGREFFHLQGQRSFQLPVGDSTLRYLQSLRDEAHRFAIESHRKASTARLQKSALDSIEGIGPKRKNDLLKHFGSVRELKNVTIEDLCKVPSINKKLATIIYQALRD